MVIETCLAVDAPAERLFALSQDYKHRLAWDPLLRRAEFVRGATTPAVGVRTVCTARSGLAMETEYVSYNPPRATAVKMTRGPWIFENFAGSWRFEERSDARTDVIFRYQFRARPARLAVAIEPVLRLILSREMKKRLAALKRAAEEMNRAQKSGTDLA